MHLLSLAAGAFFGMLVVATLWFLFVRAMDKSPCLVGCQDPDTHAKLQHAKSLSLTLVIGDAAALLLTIAYMVYAARNQEM